MSVNLDICFAESVTEKLQVRPLLSWLLRKRDKSAYWDQRIKLLLTFTEQGSCLKEVWREWHSDAHTLLLQNIFSHFLDRVCCHHSTACTLQYATILIPVFSLLHKHIADMTHCKTWCWSEYFCDTEVSQIICLLLKCKETPGGRRWEK